MVATRKATATKAQRNNGVNRRVTRSTTAAAATNDPFPVPAATADNNRKLNDQEDDDDDDDDAKANTKAPVRQSRRLRSQSSSTGLASESPRKRQKVKQDRQEETFPAVPAQKVKPEQQQDDNKKPAVVVTATAAAAAAVRGRVKQEEPPTITADVKVDRKGKGRMVITSTTTKAQTPAGSSSASTPSLIYSNEDSSASPASVDTTFLESLEENKDLHDAEEEEDDVIVLSSTSEAEDDAIDLTSTDNGEDDDDGDDDGDDDDDDDSDSDPSEDGSEDEGAFRRVRVRCNQRSRRRVTLRRGPRMTHAQRTNMYLLRHHPELKNVWDELDAMTSNDPIPVDQPSELKLPLLPFQRYGVGWMRQQEELNDFKGGVLGDEMGMGKTIQTIALLLSDRKKPNLVIAPTVAIMQWKHEIEQHTDSALKVLIFHGSKRNFTAEELQSHDVVLTTYSLLEGEFRRQESGRKIMGELRKEKSILHNVKWHRIILDEAHNIKDRASNTARATFNLNGEYRWSLTGTPLQNRVGELYSLIRFMQADPFAYYYCKSCDCKKISWQFSDKKGCDDCSHTPMEHVCWWNNEVLKPIQNHGNQGEGRIAMQKLRKLLDKMMLRRTKVECADDLGLPPRIVTVRRDQFTEEEEDVYTSLYSNTARQFTTYVEEGSILNNYANIFELLTRMRLCANHPDLVTKKKDLSGNKQLVCMLCSEPPEDAIRAACRHVFCRECCTQYLQSFDAMDTKQRPKCPTCFANFSVDLSQPPLELEVGSGTHSGYTKTSIVNRIDMDKWRSSTKIEALVEELHNLRREDRTIKSIVFSQFVNFLDLIHWRLSRAGFECIRLDGQMSPQQRDAAIKHFMTKPSVTVFLISLKAGGVALNLTEASRVFICDPWWNPAAELQAMDRIHRLGQRRPIKITRLVIENSIESRIVQLQEKKTALVESTLGKDTSALEQLSVDDLRFLFVL
ncbi:SNF2 family N-terminal domain-containing protein [Zychaea mexicana]|uniref:SNF2 family N-terminal domain-containing protein n=1 Tax=Zychaea mexicana TaxID=64656 RepID=UPI0022FF23FA|nr:SNF2 family N-terminal domain-containing protein [Zychaea mexicana]KAI9491231.1 SNF2 family N-terminal domain-containing protein [Zychaea mexicana]